MSTCGATFHWPNTTNGKIIKFSIIVTMDILSPHNDHKFYQQLENHPLTSLLVLLPLSLVEVLIDSLSFQRQSLFYRNYWGQPREVIELTIASIGNKRIEKLVITSASLWSVSATHIYVDILYSHHRAGFFSIERLKR